MNTYIEKLPRPIAVIGMGKSGRGAYDLLQKIARVPLADLITFDEKKGLAEYSDLENLLRERSPKTLVVSPGVDLRQPKLLSYLTGDIQLTSELNIAASFLTNERLIGITGSIGKSTTTTLIGLAIRSLDPNVFVGGNLGIPLASYILDLHTLVRPKAKWVVLELSSFQLENSNNLEIDFALVTYLSGNHLERYKNIDDYYSTKWTLCKKAKQKVFLNSLSPDLVAWQKSQTPIQAKICWCKPNSTEFANAKLIGEFNHQNLALAKAVAEDIGVKPMDLRSLIEFGGLPHRLENLGTFNEVLFINDSKATAIESVQVAVLASAKLPPKSSVLWVLLGGRDKNLDWSKLAGLKQTSNLRFLFFGEAAKKIKTDSALDGPIYPSLRALLGEFTNFPKAKDVVLLSPGGTSLDEFKGFEDRGDFFRSWVQAFRKK